MAPLIRPVIAPVPHGGRHVTRLAHRRHLGLWRAACSCGERGAWHPDRAGAELDRERHELDHVE
jgi:hypothetical protein